MRARELVNDSSMDPVRGQVLRVRWGLFKVAHSGFYILMDQYYHFLSVNATITVLNECRVIVDQNYLRWL